MAQVEGRGLLRWAGGIMVGLGVGHLSLLAVMAWDDIGVWVEKGLWAAVPLGPADGPAEPALQNAVTFWAGPGSFSVPLVLLGCLVWHLAGRGAAVPAWVGWGLAAWCVLGGILLVPSPFVLGAVAGALVVLAARRRAAAPGSSAAPGGSAAAGADPVR
ncbi:DUF6463 family protein [Streptomyces sp. CC228A]|uniref:DUF6463 family protein n=1 Tax=Streptomyces sp. CC228A TaxID=2898186 RepID=UPI001F263038|nr:DUF6463 family protein [Streptomyces sp. CC228A]